MFESEFHLEEFILVHQFLDEDTEGHLSLFVETASYEDAQHEPEFLAASRRPSERCRLIGTVKFGSHEELLAYFEE